VKQGCVLAPTLFAIFFSMMLREAKEDLDEGIYIRFRTDGSVFNLRRLMAHTKTSEEAILDLLFADDCALLAHTEEALQVIVDRFSQAAKAFGLTISLKKTEVLHQKAPGTAYTAPLISIDGRPLATVEHFTYHGDQRCGQPPLKGKQCIWPPPKQSMEKPLLTILHKDASLPSCCTVHTAIRIRGMGAVPETNKVSGAVPSEMPPVYHGHQVEGLRNEHRSPRKSSTAKHRANGHAKTTSLGRAHHLMPDTRMPKTVFYGELVQGKRNTGAPQKRFKDQLKKQLSQADINPKTWEQSASDRGSWRASTLSGTQHFEETRRQNIQEKRRRRKDPGPQHNNAGQIYTCPQYHRPCRSRIGLISHQRACRPSLARTSH